MVKKEKKTIRQRINEAKALDEKGQIDEAINLLMDLLREKYGKPTIEETVESLDIIASLKKQKY